MSPACRSAIRSGRGSATVEFALVAPVLVMLLLGVCDLAAAAMAKLKFSNATQSVADVASQFSVVQGTDLANFFVAGADAMAPLSATNASFRISNIASNGQGQGIVYWSCATGVFSPLTAVSAVTSTPSGTALTTVLNVAASGLNTSYVLVEGQYTYTAPAQFILTAPQVMKIYAYTLPRNSAYIIPWGGDPNYYPPAPASTHYVASYPLSGGVNCTSAF